MEADIIPGNPPPLTIPTRKSRERWDRVVQQVKELAADRESEGWAYVGDYSPGVAVHIRNGNYRSFLPSDMNEDQAKAYMRNNWELTTRKQGADRRVGLWIRWIGD